MRQNYRVDILFFSNICLNVLSLLIHWTSSSIFYQICYLFSSSVNILAKSSNRPLRFLSFVFKYIIKLAILFATPDMPVCQ